MAWLRVLRRTSLLVRFAILSAVLVAVLGVVLSTVFASLTRRTTVEALTKSITTDVTALTALIRSEAGGDPGQLTAAQARLAHETFDAYLSHHAFAGYEAYLPDGTVVASEDTALVGKRVIVSPQIRQAFDGRISSTVDGACSGSHGRQLCRRQGQLLEFFMPLHDKGTPSPDAVIRGWLPFAATQATIDRDVHRIWALLGAGLLILYLALFRLMARASRRLRQDAEFHRKRAARDVLTGLDNRSVLPDRVADALAAASRSESHTALVLIDLDHFKEVNDGFGHHVGDLVLQHTARQLQSTVRPGDTVVRLGGDEFVVVLPDIASAQAAIEAAKRLLAAVATPLEVDAATLVTRGSAGVALAPGDGDSFRDLLRRADMAMYRAKVSPDGVRQYSELAESPAVVDSGAQVPVGSVL